MRLGLLFITVIKTLTKNNSGDEKSIWLLGTSIIKEAKAQWSKTPMEASFLSSVNAQLKTLPAPEV